MSYNILSKMLSKKVRISQKWVVEYFWEKNKILNERSKFFAKIN